MLAAMLDERIDLETPLPEKVYRVALGVWWRFQSALINVNQDACGPKQSAQHVSPQLVEASSIIFCFIFDPKFVSQHPVTANLVDKVNNSR